MNAKKVTPQKKSPGRPARGLNVRKFILLDAPLNRALATAATRYGSEGHVVRLALKAFFLAEGVSISNGERDGHAQEAV